MTGAPGGEPAAGRLEALLAPRSVVLVGASDNVLKIPGRALDYLKRYGYAGAIYPVNPARSAVQGYPAYASVGDVPGPVDMAIVAVPAAAAPEAVRACAAAGAAVVVVFSSGFAETGRRGASLQRELAAAAGSSRLLGPNCLGVINLHCGLTATFTSALDALDPKLGPIGFVTQSGAFGSMIFGAAQNDALGLSLVVNTGNEADLTVPEVAGALIESDDVQVLLGYIENVRDGPALLQVARRALALGKPVVMVKVGRSSTGKAAAASHTGALAGEDVVYDGVFQQFGIHRAAGMEELLDVGRAHAAGRLPAGRRVTVVTISGGAGVLMADLCADLRLQMPPWRGEWRRQMARLIPAYGSARNPVDVTATLITEPGLLRDVLALTIEHPGTDLIVLVLGNVTRGEDDLVAAIVAAQQRTAKPIFVAWVGGTGRPRRALSRAGVPVYPDPGRALRSAAALAGYAEVRARGASARPARRPPRSRRAKALAMLGSARDRASGLLDERESKVLLSLYGMPTVAESEVRAPDEAVAAAARIGYPVAVKVLAADLIHKTDAGAVRLGLRTAAEVGAAAAELASLAGRLELADTRLLVQAMAGPGLELILGARHDPSFGPVILAGAGGILTETLADRVVGVPPLTSRQADVMLAMLRAGRLLSGWRGGGPLDRRAARSAIVSLSDLMSDLGEEIAELDVNPLIVGPAGAVAVDALVRVRRER